MTDCNASIFVPVASHFNKSVCNDMFINFFLARLFYILSINLYNVKLALEIKAWETL